MEQFVSTFSASGHPPKETCRQCRFRKVRCDGRRGEKGCGDCDRLKFDCSFVATPSTYAGPAPRAPPTSSTPPIAGGGGGGGSSSHFFLTGVNDGGGASIGSALPSPTATFSNTESARVVERRRTSKACTHCRQQKVRCSGGAPCLACKKKGVACVYGTDRRRGSRVATTTGNSSIAGTPTESSFPVGGGGNTDDGSIQEAADDTSATSPTTPGTTSSEPATVTHHHQNHHHQTARAGPLLLPPDLQVLVEFYFNNVYALPSYAFLHPQTTIRQCSEGGLETCLSYAISAVASYHRGPAQSRGDVELSWIQAAEDLIWKHLESPSLARVQALLLVVLYRVETGTIQRAFMLSSLAARAAAALRLNHERTAATGPSGSATNNNNNKISQEVRRRTMWSLKLVERYFSMGLPEFELCPVDSIYLHLPSWEQEFSSISGLAEDSLPQQGEQQQQQQQQQQRSLQTCDFGSYHLYIKLEMLRRDIMKLTRSLALHDDAPFPQLPALLNDFEHHLRLVGQDLPNGPTLTTERIAQLIGTPWLPRQILVYLSYHQCHCDLYRLLLRGYREAVPSSVLDALQQDQQQQGPGAGASSLLDKAEQLCLQHATAIADILATLNHQSQRAQLLEFDTAICGYHATRLLLFIAQHGRGRGRGCGGAVSEEWALSRAELCVASLRRFFLHSTLVRPVLEEMRKVIAAFTSSSSSSSRGGGSTTATSPNRVASSSPTMTTTTTPGYKTGSYGTKDAMGGSGGLSAAARVRQRLAIHSLLRQADFTDDEDEPPPQQPRHQQQPPEELFLRRGSNLVPPTPRGVSPGTTAETNTDMGLLSRASSSLSLYSPRPHASDAAESWPFQWLAEGEFGGDGGGGGGGGGGGPGGGTSSFSFPWLQRLESPRGTNGEI